MTHKRFWTTLARFATWSLLALSPAWGQLTTLSTVDPSKVSQAFTVVLMDRGFRHEHFYLKAGATAVLIQNRSRLSSLTVRITQSGQTTAALTSQHTAGQRDNTFYFTLQPGTYNFTVDEQSSWKSVLEVTEK